MACAGLARQGREGRALRTTKSTGETARRTINVGPTSPGTRASGRVLFDVLDQRLPLLFASRLQLGLGMFLGPVTLSESKR